MTVLIARLRPWLRMPVVQDAGLVLVLAAATFVWNRPTLEGADLRASVDMINVGAPEWVITGATLVCLAALGVRRRWPVGALVVAVLASGVHMAFAADPAPADLAAPIILYTLTYRSRRRVGLIALGATLVIAIAWSVYVENDGKFDGWRAGQVIDGGMPPMGRGLAIGRAEIEGGGIIGPTAWGGLPLFGALIGGWAVGSSVRNRRAYLDELTARARDLERERDQHVALAAAAERGRIARELHDVVAHGLSVIVTQAQGGAAALDKRPSDTLTALGAIVETGRASLADMRHVLAAVGTDADGHATDPVPGVGRLPHLVERVREAGTEIDFHVDGTPVPLPTAVDLAGYRIVQEALTNVVKYAGPAARAQVLLQYDSEAVTIEIADDGDLDPPVHEEPQSTGHGLRGMRERVDLLGGTFSTVRAARGGFVVHARIPYQAERDTGHAHHYARSSLRSSPLRRSEEDR